MPSDVSTSSRVLRVGILTRIHTLNPWEARDLLSSLVIGQIFETPYGPPRGEGPAQALLFAGPLEREYTNGSVAVYSAVLRPGVTFSDGTPLTAGHIVNSLSRVDALRELGSVEARGDSVVFTLPAPNPRLDLALTLIHCGVVLERAGRLLGTGPYVPAPEATLDAMRLVRNKHYRARLGIDEVVFRVYPPDKEGRPQALIKAIEAGEVDFTNMLSRTDAAGVSGVKKSFQPSSATAMLYFNTERPALRDAVSRRAMAMAIDRLALAEISYANALAFAATSPLPPVMGVARDELGHDLERARGLLAQSGLARPGRLRLLIVWAPRPYLPNPQPVAELIAKQLEALGLEVQIVVPRTSDDFFRACEGGDYDMVPGGWIADTPDPADFLEANLKSDRIQAPGVTGVASCNLARFKSGAMDAALARFREAPGPETRAAVLRILSEEAPLVPLMYGPTVVVHSWRVKNVEVSPLGIPNFADFALEA